MKYKIYGPYDHSDGNGRKNIIRVYEDGTRKTVALARHIMELHLGRELSTDEVVDHIDENPLNDVIENLQIITIAENTRKQMEWRKARGISNYRKGKFEPVNHGTMYGWMKRKCTCDICETAKRKWYDERNAKRRNSRS